jgi:hypothetical protein
MQEAKRALKTIASAELQYQKTDPSHNYGSFQMLVEPKDLVNGLTLGRSVEGYSLALIPESGVAESFTIYAMPYDTRPGFLSTFAVLDDQLVREYTPYKGNSPFDVGSWEPVMVW